jgi:hypothetical protein
VLVLGAWCWVPVLVLVLVLVRVLVRVPNAQCWVLAPTCIVHRTHARASHGHLAPAPST